MPGPPQSQLPDHRDEDKTVPPRGMLYVAQTGLPKISGYEIIREIGCGGMGRVFEASDEQLGRQVALKVLSDPLSHHEPELLQRFLQEGRLAARISHPRSTFVYEAGFDQQRPYIVMELMPGRTLKDELNEFGKLPIQRAVDVTLDVIDGLAAAHELGVVHRDVKPANCFVEENGRVKIGDFGLSKSLLGDVETTQMGSFMGTPCFASPEQIRGERIDERSDVYSLGVTLFNLLGGRPPFVGDSISVAAQIVSDAPPSLRDLAPEVPKDLEEIILRAMEKSPADRYQNLEAMRHDLLPFASRGTSLAEIGRRVAAFMIDYGVVQLTVQVMVLVVALIIMAMNGFGDALEQEDVLQRVTTLAFLQNLGGWLATLALFAIGDGLWGRTPGKWLMSLRVVNLNGERPGFWRGLLRAIVIPGAFGLPLIFMLTNQFWRNSKEFDASELETVSLLYNLLPLSLLGLVALLTMRQKTNLRGIHEWLSQTRTIAIPIVRKRKHPAIKGLPFETFAEPYHLGRFRILGGLPSNKNGAGIFLGQDEILDRRAIVFCSESHSGTDIAGFQVNRPTRKRWFQGGYEGAIRWDAFENHGGVPFSYLTNRVTDLDWGTVKSAVFDLAREIAAAIQDGTLPKRLTFDNFMITREGQGRLIDLPVNVFDATRFVVDVNRPSESNDLERGLSFLRDVLDWSYVHLIMPKSANEMVNEFRSRENNLETLNWLREALDQENRRISEMTWDSRIGAMAFSVAIEWTVAAGLTSLFSWFVLSYIGYFPLWKPMWCWLAALFGVYVVGGLTRGGPAFRLMGVEVRNKNGDPAPASICGLRATLSWMGVCAAAVASTFFIELGNESIQEQRQSLLATQQIGSTGPPPSEEVSFMPDKEPHRMTRKEMTQILVMTTLVLIGLVITFLGAAYAIYSPQRGIPDRLLGTQLIPS